MKKGDAGTLPELIARAAAILRSVRYLVIFTGAGVSRESGIPTFREAQTGLWEQYNPEDLATPAAFRRNPELVWNWYGYRQDMVESIQPNLGHRALAALEQLIPRVVVLTQNIDGLHRAAGSSDVVELHGNLLRAKCSTDCRGAPTIVDVSTLPDRDAAPPRCPYCGSFLRPDIVWFGEVLPEDALDRASRVSAECDAMLVVGTSGVVFPAAAIPIIASEAGAPIIEVNPEPSGITPLADVYLGGPGGEVLPELLAAVRGLEE